MQQHISKKCIAVLLLALAAVIPPCAAQAREQQELHSFTGGSDGYIPEGRLLRDKQATFYGTTYGGGAHGQGVVFKLAPDGTERVLHSFVGGASDGAYPTNAGLALDRAGNLYGMTQFGGTSDYGTVFKVA